MDALFNKWGNLIMKKAVCVILGLIIVFGARPLYGLVNNEVSFNTGMSLI